MSCRLDFGVVKNAINLFPSVQQISDKIWFYVQKATAYAEYCRLHEK